MKFPASPNRLGSRAVPNGSSVSGAAASGPCRPAAASASRWRTSSAMLTIGMPCRPAKRRSSGSRAMLPSALITSQITAAGFSPARRSRSIEPSVWPARASTPPGAARSGKTWPGVTRSSGFASSAAAARMVRARSRAEMPVSTPSRAPIETVKAVPRGAVLWRTIIGSCSRSSCAASSDRQTRPRAWVTRKLTASGVACSAASTRSPSFSRSSSSTRMTMRRDRRAAIASATAGPGSGRFRSDADIAAPRTWR